MDANDLLIFKMRGAQKPKVKETGEPAKQQSPTGNEKDLPMVAEGEGRGAESAPGRIEMPVAQAAKGEEAEVERAAAEGSVAVEKEEAATASAYSQSQGESIHKFLSERVEEQQEVRGKKFTKSEKTNIKAARGMNCTNHPWRPAYAMCEYCKRPFCYADLISYGKNFYCLEDIDRVSSKATNQSRKAPKMLLNAIGLLFLANTIVLGYFVYPQAYILFGQLAKTGISFFYTLSYNYILLILNAAVVLFGLVAAAMVFGKHDNGPFIAGSIAAVSTLLLSYEYLTTDAFYLLVVSIFELFNIAVLAYGRINMVEESYEKEVEPLDIDWPGIESF